MAQYQEQLPAGQWKQVEVRLDTPSSAWPRDSKFDVATVDRLVIAIGDNRTTQDAGRVVFIDDAAMLCMLHRGIHRES